MLAFTFALGLTPLAIRTKMGSQATLTLMSPMTIIAALMAIEPEAYLLAFMIREVSAIALPGV